MLFIEQSYATFPWPELVVPRQKTCPEPDPTLSSYEVLSSPIWLLYENGGTEARQWWYTPLIPVLGR